MQRYHAGSCTSAVNNSTIGGPSSRDTGRSDSSFPAHFPVNSRLESLPSGTIPYCQFIHLNISDSSICDVLQIPKKYACCA